MNVSGGEVEGCLIRHSRCIPGPNAVCCNLRLVKPSTTVYGSGSVAADYSFAARVKHWYRLEHG